MIPEYANSYVLILGYRRRSVHTEKRPERCHILSCLIHPKKTCTFSPEPAIFNPFCHSDEILSGIFEDDPSGYQSLYRQRTTSGVLDWIDHLRSGLSQTLRARRVNYKELVIQNVQAYIHANLDKRLALSDVAAVFGFTPNYLSRLFARSASSNFVEYTTNAKIERAKELLASGKYKVYEVAEQLGFENAFYFSRVFRKVTGQSPREYSQGGSE